MTSSNDKRGKKLISLDLFIFWKYATFFTRKT